MLAAMHTVAVVLVTLTLFAVSVVDALTVQLKPIVKFAGPTHPDSYIVTLKEGASKDAHLEWLTSVHGKSSNITHGEWQSDILHGFAGTFGRDALNALRANPDVESIAENGLFSISCTQTNAPWGLQRITQVNRTDNQNPSLLNFKYTSEEPQGEGVDIYILDTGIMLSHSEFEGRATWGMSVGTFPTQDDNGHGTHLAGIAGGATFGAAKKANLIAVKVIGKSGVGQAADIISGLNFVARQATATGHSSVANLSFNGPASDSMDAAVTALINKGIHVVAAAGNKNTDAGLSSPARVEAAITVGASTIADARQADSNFGAVVDLFAPGENIISAGIASDTATAVMSGSSMATPLVAGIIAYSITAQGQAHPGDMATRLQNFAVPGALSGIPAGTNNCLAHNQPLPDGIFW
ncbi:serine protease [Earliella scabrosa]|nr:serine protease [Earliella scabrosa]